MTGTSEFDRLFEAHFAELVQSLTAITGDRELARDCVQEAFVRAYARWRRVRLYDNPVTWIRRVAINLSRDAHRSDTRRRRREDRVGNEQPAVREAEVETVTSGLHLVALLDHLTPQQRAVAALFYLEDISVAEIGVSLGISAGAVKFHLNKARSTLKVVIEREAAVHD